MSRQQHLQVVPGNCRAGTEPDAGRPDLRSDLHRLCAGEPVHSPSVDLLAFVNGGWEGLGADRNPGGDYTLGEVMLELFHKNVGTDRRTKGDRAVGIVSDLVRYLLPFAVETAAWCDHGERGIAQLRVPTGGRTAADPRR